MNVMKLKHQEQPPLINRIAGKYSQMVAAEHTPARSKRLLIGIEISPDHTITITPMVEVILKANVSTRPYETLAQAIEAYESF